MILPGQRKETLALGNFCRFSGEGAGGVFEGIGAQGRREAREKKRQKDTRQSEPAGTRGGHFLLGEHGVTG